MRIETLIGSKFGILTIKEHMKNNNYLCTCECGISVIATTTNLKRGRKKSCGCLRKKKASERAIQRNTTHKLSYHPLYNRWKQMIKRCHNVKHKRYQDYGGRGIIVCERWHNVENFINDMNDSYVYGLTLERINNNGNYEPSNCRWATYKEQNQNQKHCRTCTCTKEYGI